MEDAFTALQLMLMA